MNEPPPGAVVDPRLLPLLAAREDEEAARVLEDLVSVYARPIVRNILGYKLSTLGPAGRPSVSRSDLEDLSSDVCVRLLERLRAMRARPHADGIGNLRAYVAVAAYNAFHQHLRERYPNRHRLQNRLRYVLNHRRRFALWRGENQEWLCGLVEWRPLPDPDRMDRREARHSSEAQGLAGDLTALLDALFRERGRPLPLDELVGEVAARCGITDGNVAVDQRPLADQSASSDPSARIRESMDRRYLAHVWREITLLPLPQRRALLLNLRDEDGCGCVELFPLSGVAGISALAETLDLPATEFAELWNRLPLADNDIAERFGLSRQNVINLRKSARRRLARRVGREEPEPA